MATVNILTKERMLQIEAESIVSGSVNAMGNLILTRFDGTTIDAGSVNPLQATNAVLGSVMLASSTEAQAGVDTQKAVTPATLAAFYNGKNGYRYLQTVIFTSSGSFVKANYPNIKALRIRLVGGGGGGGAAPAATTGNHSSGGGGGGGGFAEKLVVASALAASETVTVGAGGAGGTTTLGSAGGTSSFGTFASATGGDPGDSANNTAVMIGAIAGNGGIGTAGDLLIAGTPGTMGSGNSTLAHGGGGGSSFYGGGGKPQYTGAGSGSLVGSPGRNYGGGGGGAAVNTSGGAAAGGAGSPGIVVVEVYV